MGFSDGEGDGDGAAEWDKSSNVSSSSSSSASSNKSKSSKHSKSSDNSNRCSSASKSNKSSIGDGAPCRKVTCEVSDDEVAPPGTTVAARPRGPFPHAGIPGMPGIPGMRMMNPMMIRPMMMPGMQPPVMMPNMMMRPMMPMPGQPMPPGSVMPSPPMLCSMAATNMAAANNPVSAIQPNSNIPRVSGAPPPTINAPPPTSKNDYMTTPLVQARLEMIRAATKMRVEPSPVDPLAKRLSFREKLVKLYSKVNPERLGDIDALLDKYAGREDKLYLGVLDKYECVVVKKGKKENSRDCDFRSGAPAKAMSESSESSERALKRPAPTSHSPKTKRTSQDKTREFFKKQIKKIYKEHNPQKLSSLEALLDKYRGKERDVWLGICDKYGVRPE